MTVRATKTSAPIEPFGVEHVKRVCREILLPPEHPEAELLWGFRLNATDLMSQHDFRWPWPGHWAVAPGPFTQENDPCPQTAGDGICVAKSLSGAQSGGQRIGASVGLLLAYSQADVLAESSDKLRVKRAWVAEMFDPVQAVVLSGADLSGANLSGTDLSGARYSQLTLWPARFDPAAAGALSGFDQGQTRGGSE